MRILIKMVYLCFLVSGLPYFSCETETDTITNAKGIERTKAEYDTFFTQLKDSLQIPGLSIAIINDSRIVYHNTSGVKMLGSEEAIDTDTYFEAASLSKPLFAYFVMKQVEKGKIDLDKPLYKYLPYPDIAYDERYKLITARMVLSHTSGFPNWREDSLKIQFMPGTNYQYSGEGYRYLAHVLAKVNEVSLSELDRLFQEEIAQSIGAEKLHYLWNEEIAQQKATGHIANQPTHNKRDNKDNDFGAAGGLHTEAISYSKFLISLFDQTVIGKASTQELLKPQVELPENDINALVIGASAWSLGFGIIPTSSGTCYWHAGNNDDFQSWMHFFPEQKYGIVLFANADKIQHPDFFNLFFDFMNDGVHFDLSKL